MTKSEFYKIAATESNRSDGCELLGYLRDNKKWWMLPIVLVFLLAAVFVLTSTTHDQIIGKE